MVTLVSIQNVLIVLRIINWRCWRTSKYHRSITILIWPWSRLNIIGICAHVVDKNTKNTSKVKISRSSYSKRILNTAYFNSKFRQQIPQIYSPCRNSAYLRILVKFFSNTIMYAFLIKHFLLVSNKWTNEIINFFWYRSITTKNINNFVYFESPNI